MSEIILSGAFDANRAGERESGAAPVFERKRGTAAPPRPRRATRAR